MSTGPLYLTCRKCMDSGLRPVGIEVAVIDGELVVACRDPKHGLIYSQPYTGPKLKCAHPGCTGGKDHAHN